MKSHLVIVGVSALAAFSSGQLKDWQEYGCEQGGFRVRMPAKPEVSVIPPNPQRGTPEVNCFTSAVSGRLFIVTYSVVAPGPDGKKTLLAQLERFRAAFKGSKVVNKAFGQHEGFLSLDGIVQAPMNTKQKVGSLIWRGVIKNRRMYEISVVWAIGNPKLEVIRYFFSSFHIG